MTELQEHEYDVLSEVLEDVIRIMSETEDMYDGLPEGIRAELERIVWQASDAEQAIRGRLNELNEDYCLYAPGTCYNKRHVKLARAAGINYVALDRVNYRDREDAIRYIKDNGLTSLNYESTCAAVKKFDEIRLKEYCEKYHAAEDINTQALMLAVPYGDLDSVIEYLRVNGYAGHDMPSTYEGIQKYYAEKRIA